MRLLEESGCAEISISVDTDNERAQELYIAAGLVEASVFLESTSCETCERSRARHPREGARARAS